VNKRVREKIIHRQNQVDPMFTFFTDRQKWKAYISLSSASGGEETGQDKNKEKKGVMLMRREK